MMKRINDIDKLFQSSIDGHEEDPPPAVWENIEAGLDKKKILYLERRNYHLKRVAIALLFFGFIASVYALYIKEGNNRTAAGSETVLNKKETTLSSPINDSVTNTTLHHHSNATQNISGEPALTPDAPNGEQPEEPYNHTGDDKSPSSDREHKSPHTTTISNDFAVQSAESGSHPKNNRANNEALSTVVHQKKLPGAFPVTLTKEEPEVPHLYAALKDVTPLFTAYNRRTWMDSSYLNRAHTWRSDITPPPAIATMPNSRAHAFSLTPFLASGLSINNMKDDDQYRGPGRNRNEIKGDEQRASYLSSGILASYSLNGKWTVSSGIVYSTRTTSIGGRTIFAKPDNRGRIQFEFNCAAGATYVTPKGGTTPSVGDSIEALSSKNTLTYISVPLSVGFETGKGRFTFIPSAGIAINFLTRGKLMTTVSTGTGASKENLNSNDIIGLKSNYLNAQFSFGASYRLSDKFSLLLTPTAQVAISSINRNSPVKTYPGFFGIGAGLKMAF